jgi:hypothetical protein
MSVRAARRDLRAERNQAARVAYLREPIDRKVATPADDLLSRLAGSATRAGTSPSATASTNVLGQPRARRIPTLRLDGPPHW